MSSGNKPLRVVFIGNVPYDATEESLSEIFRRVGPVVDFRLVFDRSTGKPKGYGFCEYADTETAQSCIRNLNRYEFNGRQLRVDFADSELGAPKEGIRKETGTKRKKDPDTLDETARARPDHYSMHTGTYRPGMMSYPPPFDHGQVAPPYGGPADSFHHPPGHDYPYSQNSGHVQPSLPTSSETRILSTLENLSPEKLLLIINRTKSLVQSSPESARSLLKNNPQLTFALFQILLKLELIEPLIVERILSAAGGSRSILPEPKPVQQMQEHQKALLAQIMQLTPQQINALPPDQREKVLLLKSQFKGEYY